MPLFIRWAVPVVSKEDSVRIFEQLSKFSLKVKEVE